MTTQTQKLTERAMLVNLSIAYWTAKASDERMGEAVAKALKNETDMTENKKLLLMPEAINSVKAVRSRARAYHFLKTSPWIDGGTRVLAATFYFDYVEKMREFETEYEGVVKTLCNNLSKLKGEARKRLGALYKETDYPTEKGLREKFSWKCAVCPIPDEDDWRVSLGAKADADVKKQIKAQVTEACAVVTRDLWQRLYDVVEHMAESLRKTDAKFHDTIIGNIKDACALLPVMNVAQDPELDKMTKGLMAGLCKFVPDEMREDPKVKKAALTEADKILEKMAGYIGGK